MARHDYNLPPDWDSMSDEEKSRWMTQDRCRRQALRQKTTSSEVIKHELHEFQMELIEDDWIYLGGMR